MENRHKNIEELERDNRAGYQVPDGYFSDLNHRIIEQTQRPAQGGIWATVRSMASFAAGFAMLAILATAGYHLTLRQSSPTELADPTADMINLYDISYQDIIDLQTTATDDQANSTQLAQAAIDHIEIYGYDLTEITE